MMERKGFKMLAVLNAYVLRHSGGMQSAKMLHERPELHRSNFCRCCCNKVFRCVGHAVRIAGKQFLHRRPLYVEPNQQSFLRNNDVVLYCRGRIMNANLFIFEMIF